MKIGDREIGPGQPCFIVAEVGLAHDGSLMAAHAYIYACARAGVDAVKFQCHLGDTNDEWRVQPSWSSETRAQYWERVAFSVPDWSLLKGHCDLRGVEFLCSPFSVEAVEFLDPYVVAWKVPSGKVLDVPMLQAIGKTGKPVLLSSGMSTQLSEKAAKRIRELLTFGFLILTRNSK